MHGRSWTPWARSQLGRYPEGRRRLSVITLVGCEEGSHTMAVSAMLCPRRGLAGKRQCTWRGQRESRKGICREREVSLFLCILIDNSYRPAWCWTPKSKGEGARWLITITATLMGVSHRKERLSKTDTDLKGQLPPGRLRPSWSVPVPPSADR